MSKKKTKEEFLTQISALYPNNDYTFLEEYIDGRTKLKVRHNCTKCNNYEFMSAPSDFLQGYGCPKCAGRMRKTQKEFEQEVFEAVGNEYTVLGTYRNGKTKLLMRHNCEKCNNHEWEVVPKNFLLNGTRCPVCAGNQKITNKDFKKRIYGLVKDEFTVIGAYKNNHAKLLMRHNCDKCNNFEWEVRPSDFLKSPSCLKCSGRMKKTTEIFKQEVYDLVGDEFSVLGEYKNAKTKILIRHNCKSCNNYEYEIKPNAFLNGIRCAKCSGLQKKTQEEFKQEVFDTVGNEYTVLGTYKNSDTKILMRHNCKNCNNHEWKVAPKNFIHNQTRCPECFGAKQKTTEVFKQEVFDLTGDEYTVIGEYTNAHTKIKMRHNCKKCNNFEYEVSPHAILKGNRCPVCNETKGPKAIMNILEKYSIDFKLEYKFDDCKYKVPLRFDFAILKKEKLIGIIEFDGSQHFKPVEHFGGKEYFKLAKLRDQIKTKYCEDNNIPLLRIKYIQFDEIETIVNDFLKNPTNYINNHSYGLTNEEYYKELKAS